jgi:hypothetical protein
VRAARGRRGAVSEKYPYWPDLTDDEGDALSEWIDDTCGDCIEGRCHWGGETSQQSIAAVARGEDFDHPRYGRCGCPRHETSVLARPFGRDHDTPQATAMAWRSAKEAGEVEVIDDDY